MPITTLVKNIYKSLVHYFVSRGQASASQLQSSHHLCKNMVDSLKHNESLATGHHVRTYKVEQTVFEVDEGYERSYSVILPERFCQCGKFKDLKYPCSHAATIALHVRQNPFQYVDDVFRKTNLVRAYSFPWQPIGNEQVIPPSADLVLIPDKSMLCAKGHLKSTRTRNEIDEAKSSQRHIM
ncbi:uncharacterized protein LOC133318659 [Gastrolobium bilobum]|uniref:uncharacterized protein LOC133318659 n=1 Tax=Gastrolobium bilobum TaxID=150636 RepID=UPI002AB27E97|nr:uncharacterized protein LOC133318659 [Gastrolobium bilobum]